MKQNVHAGHRDRLRSRFEKGDTDSFEPHQLMELILFEPIPLRDTNELGHHLINKFGSIHDVFTAKACEMTDIKGIGEKTADYLVNMGEAIRRYAREECELSDKPDTVAVAVYLRRLLDCSYYNTAVMTYGDNGFMFEFTDGVSDIITVTSREIFKNNAVSFAVYCRDGLDGDTMKRLRTLAEMTDARYIELV